MYKSPINIFDFLNDMSLNTVDFQSGIHDRIELMQTFVRIVEAGSMTAAAKQLGTTQPTISRRLKMLEQYLGLHLLKRTTQSLVLTADGERCYERLKDLLATWGTVESDLRGAKEEPNGVLRVLAPHAFGQDHLIEPLANYLASYPNMSVEWNLHDDRSLHDFIAEGIDCAIHVGQPKDQNMVLTQIGEVSRSIIASPELFKHYPVPQHPDDLAALPWVSLSTFYQSEIELKNELSGELAKIKFNPRLRTDNLYAMKNAVVQGVGIGVGSTWIVLDDLASGKLINLLPEWSASRLPVYLIYPYARFYPAKLRCFVRSMKERLPEIFEPISDSKNTDKTS